MRDFSGFMSKGAIPALLAAMMIAGCGGTSGGMTPGNTQPGQPQPQTGQPLATMTIKGAPAFVNSASHTVYVFDADLASPGQSVCNGACAQNWPPVAAPTASLPAGWSVITRADSTKQLAYLGRPLYTFVLDTAAGQANGDGVNAFGGIWHIARPQAASPVPSSMPSVMPTVNPSPY